MHGQDLLHTKWSTIHLAAHKMMKGCAESRQQGLSLTHECWASLGMRTPGALGRELLFAQTQVAISVALLDTVLGDECTLDQCLEFSGLEEHIRNHQTGVGSALHLATPIEIFF